DTEPRLSVATIVRHRAEAPPLRDALAGEAVGAGASRVGLRAVAHGREMTENSWPSSVITKPTSTIAWPPVRSVAFVGHVRSRPKTMMSIPKRPETANTAEAVTASPPPTPARRPR